MILVLMKDKRSHCLYFSLKTNCLFLRQFVFICPGRVCICNTNKQNHTALNNLITNGEIFSKKNKLTWKHNFYFIGEDRVYCLKEGKTVILLFYTNNISNTYIIFKTHDIVSNFFDIFMFNMHVDWTFSKRRKHI